MSGYRLWSDCLIDSCAAKWILGSELASAMAQKLSMVCGDGAVGLVDICMTIGLSPAQWINHFCQLVGKHTP